MRYLLFIFLISSSLFSQEYSLDVSNGHGGGKYPKGIDINVWANQNIDTLIFSHWTGSATQFIQNSENWHSVVNIPIENTFKNFTILLRTKKMKAVMTEKPKRKRSIINQKSITNTVGTRREK